MAIELIDNFEDGDTTAADGWSGWDDTSFAPLTTTSTNPLAGTTSGSITGSDTSGFVYATRDSPTTQPLSLRLRIDSQLGAQNDGLYIGLQQAGTQTLGEVEFRSNGNIVWDDGTQLTTWSADVEYIVDIIPDFEADTATVEIDGTEVGSGLPIASASDWDRVWFDHITNSNTADEGFTATIDDLLLLGDVPSASGLSGSVVDAAGNPPADQFDLSFDYGAVLPADLDSGHRVQLSLDDGGSWVTETTLDATYALDFANDGDEINFNSALSIPAGADVELRAWLDFDEYLTVNQGLLRSGSGSGGGEFFIFQASGGLPWIRWDGVEILKPSSGYEVPLNQPTQVRFRVTSAGVAEFYTRSAESDPWDLKHAAAHSVSTPAHDFYRYGWQAAPRQFVDGQHDAIEIDVDGTTVVSWQLDEGTGSTIDDSSGNGNSGSLSGPEYADPVQPLTLTTSELLDGRTYDIRIETFADRFTAIDN